LITAVERFDVEQGNKFCTYATWWIKAKLNREIPQQNKAIGYTQAIARQVRMLKSARSSLISKTGLEPSSQDLADALGWTPKKAIKYMGILEQQKSTSLDAPLSNEDGDTGMITMLRSSKSDYKFETSLDESLIHSVLEKLEPVERDVLFMRFGFHPHTKPYTLDEIGKQLGCSRQNINRIEAKALSKLRIPEYAEQLRVLYEESLNR